MDRKASARWAVVVVASALFVSCAKQEPIRVGFVAGLSGRGADLGIGGRNGAMLAIEERNAAGGVNGRSIELIVRDDEHNPETARRVVSELIGEKLEVIIGPMTSSIAMTSVPLVNASPTILVAPTVTTKDLEAKDDNFLRIVAVTAAYADKSAHFQYEKRGSRTVAVVYDIGNKAYSESWWSDFRKSFEGLGGRVVKEVQFKSGNDVVFMEKTTELLSSKPDLVLVIANAVDAALISQQVRKLRPTQEIALSEWGSTERFAELAGTAAENIHVAQFIDQSDSSPRYQAFLKNYRERFRQEPGFAGATGYDAAQVVLEALSLQKPGQSVKDVILAKKVFAGVQEAIHIDRFGDADRTVVIAVIRNGKYHKVE
jgi:branched-chain amino acid transport system substrate-binding protein